MSRATRRHGKGLKLIKVREMTEGEADTLGAILFEAIHHGPPEYSQAQRMAWAPKPPTGPAWVARLAAQHVWVAARRSDALGFLTLDEAGYIDLAFVRSDAQRQGIFAALYRQAEDVARALGMASLHTHASLTAQPAFARQGFHVTQHETVERSGQSLRRAEMEKALT
ncbi:GNAT family N-acetyltransferase [uncultured Tateyamaria sp.]|uniref:GNAT family N-acetyltransferase n=1 Tax=uncultured Tateyamaria sp. TaxID=455651 RepID=UPI00261B57FF|nr:GNAT family N-acetyltransferase [uncultured Tateyamaria sp.]